MRRDTPLPRMHEEHQMGGKASKGTKKDRRLKANKPKKGKKG